MYADSANQSTGKSQIILAVCLAALVLPLSFSGGAVATPAIGAELHSDPIALNWITNAFMLTFGASLMAAGALADQFGRKRIFISGIAAFSALSLTLSFAPSILVLDLLRAFQGFAAAAALAGGTAALAQEFDGAARARVFSVLGTTFGLGLAFGPLLAGFLIAHFGWRATFISSTVIGLVSLSLAIKRMDESRDPDAAGLDLGGTLTFTGALTLFTYGCIEAAGLGWGHRVVTGALIGAAVMLFAFIRIETRSARPMLDLSLFRYRRFLGVQVLPIATCYCYVVLLVLLPLRLIGIGGLNAFDAGLTLVALSAPMLVVPLAATFLTRWISAAVLCAAGLMVAALGLFWLGHLDPRSSGMQMMFPLLLIGMGTGLPWGLMDGLSVSVVPKERAGMATGIFSTTRVAGEGIALAIVNVLLAGLIQARLSSVSPALNGDSITTAAQQIAVGNVHSASLALPDLNPALFYDSYQVAFRELTTILVVITVISAVVIFFLLGRPSSQSRDLGGAANASPEQVAES